MDEFHCFSDLPEPLCRAIFQKAWLDRSGWHPTPDHGACPPNRNHIRLVCRQACAAIDDVVKLCVMRVNREQEQSVLDACIQTVGSGRFPALREWRVASVPARPADGTITALAQAKSLSLETLDLQGICFGQAAAAALAGSAVLPALRQLSVSCAGLESPALHALAQGFGPRLEMLSLWSSQMDAQGAAALANAAMTRLPALKRLNLSYNKLNDAGVRVLAQVTWPALEDLDLGSNNVTHWGAEALAAASARRLPKLRLLCLNNNTLSDAGVQALMQAMWPALEELDLGHNEVTALGAEVLTDASPARLPALRQLSLSYNLELGDAGVRALLRRPWARLQQLQLMNVGVGMDGVAAAAAAAAYCFPELTFLWISDSQMGIDGVRALLLQAPWTRLDSLSLSVAGFEVQGMAALAAASLSQLPALQMLFLEVNDLCSASIAAMADGEWRRLLLLHFCTLGDARNKPDNAGAAEALAAAGTARFPALRSLAVQCCVLSEGQEAALRAAWPDADVQLNPRPAAAPAGARAAPGDTYIDINGDDHPRPGCFELYVEGLACWMSIIAAFLVVLLPALLVK